MVKHFTKYLKNVKQTINYLTKNVKNEYLTLYLINVVV